MCHFVNEQFYIAKEYNTLSMGLFPTADIKYRHHTVDEYVHTGKII